MLVEISWYTLTNPVGWVTDALTIHGIAWQIVSIVGLVAIVAEPAGVLTYLYYQTSGNFYLKDCFCDVFGEELAKLNKFFQSNGAIPGKNENLPKYTEWTL